MNIQPRGLKTESVARTLLLAGILSEYKIETHKFGSGPLNITSVNGSYNSVNLNYNLGFGGVAVGLDGVKVSLGWKIVLSLGINSEGLVFGFNTNYKDGHSSGVEYQWSPSDLFWGVALIPILRTKSAPTAIPKITL